MLYRAVSLLLIALIATPAQAAERQAGAAGANSPVRTVKIGQTVTVVLTDGERIKGKITAMSGEAVTVGVKNRGERTIPLDAIAAVKKPWPMAAKILLGVGVGYGALAGIWLLAGGIDVLR